MIDIKTMYYDIGKALDGVCDKLYARSRPKSVVDRPGNYIVVSLPYSISNGEMNSDGAYNDYTTDVQIEIYVKDKCSAHNPNMADIVTLDEKVREVMNRFPIRTSNIIVTRPRMTLQADDGCGYGVAIVMGRLRTR